LNSYFLLQPFKMLVPAWAGLFVLSGCGSFSYDFSDVKPQKPVHVAATVSTAAAGASPRFEDRRPHDWQNRTPWHYPVHGTDISRYQQDVDWHELRRSRISFAYIKATEGGDRLDDYFSRNWHQAKEAGVARGAYHFYYFCRSAEDQARWFIRNVPKDGAALPPVLDMEWNHASATCKLRPAAETIRHNMQIFLDMIEQHYEKRPVIYTTMDFFEDNGLHHFSHYPLWLRSVAGHPEEKYGKHPWTFWQYTGTGSIPGIKGDADINVFAGSHEEWQTWLGHTDDTTLQASNKAATTH